MTEQTIRQISWRWHLWWRPWRWFWQTYESPSGRYRMRWRGPVIVTEFDPQMLLSETPDE